MHRLRRIIVRRKQKTIQGLVQRLANEKSSYVHGAHGSFRGAVCVCLRLFSLSPLSPLPSFSSLLSPSLSVCLKKSIWGSARQESSHTRMVWRASNVSSPFLLSFPFPLFLSLRFLLFLSLSPLSSSPRFVFKTRFGEARARKAATWMV